MSSKHLRSGSQAFDRVRWLCDEAQKPAPGKQAHSNPEWCPAMTNQLAPSPHLTSCSGLPCSRSGRLGSPDGKANTG